MSDGHVDILLVEDEQKFRENTRLRLEKRGYTVHEVERGDDAISRLAKRQIVFGRMLLVQCIDQPVSHFFCIGQVFFYYRTATNS